MASIPVTISTICVIVIAILIPDTALGGFFNFVALPTAYWKWMVLIVLAYGIAVQLVKTIYIKINKEWL